VGVVVGGVGGVVGGGGGGVYGGGGRGRGLALGFGGVEDFCECLFGVGEAAGEEPFAADV
jgi:hypothetical protein